MSIAASVRQPGGDHRREVGDPLDEFERVVRDLVLDLHLPRPLVFWLDLTCSAALGWSALVAAIVVGWSKPPIAVISTVIAALALYRGLSFIHELTHLRPRALPGFETAWNLLFGVPFLLPSFTYIGVHQGHHGISTYGTRDDPEYLPFAKSRALILSFAVQSSIALPLLLIARFLCLAPVGLLWPRFHRWLEANASSFSMNQHYRRVVSAAVASKIRRWEAATLGAWAMVGAAIWWHLLPLRALALWTIAFVIISFLNTLRVLGAHEYDSGGRPTDRLGQLRDSIDTPGGSWTALWAPVGLRYHALHHYFPGIPYHNLGVAYRRIVGAVPVAESYRESTSESLWRSLRELYHKAQKGDREEMTRRFDDAFRDH